MQESNPKILIELTYHAEKREGFATQEAHYAGTGTLPGGKTVTAAGLTWDRAVTEIRRLAATELGQESWASWEWAEAGRKGFPAGVEAKIKAEEEEDARQAAEHKAQADRLRAVAEEIKKSAPPPDGYTWEIQAPDQDYDIGNRCWLYAKKGGEAGIALSITRKPDHARDDIWIEGPGYGKDARRCKAGTKGPWAAKAASFIYDNIAHNAQRTKDEAARKAHLASKEALRDAIVAATPGAVAEYHTGISFGGKYSAQTATIITASETGVSIEIKVTLDPDDAKAIIKLAAEACARRKARYDAEEAARKAATPAPAQG